MVQNITMINIYTVSKKFGNGHSSSKPLKQTAPKLVYRGNKKFHIYWCGLQRYQIYRLSDIDTDFFIS